MAPRSAPPVSLAHSAAGLRLTAHPGNRRPREHPLPPASLRGWARPLICIEGGAPPSFRAVLTLKVKAVCGVHLHKGEGLAGARTPVGYRGALASAVETRSPDGTRGRWGAEFTRRRVGGRGGACAVRPRKDGRGERRRERLVLGVLPPSLTPHPTPPPTLAAEKTERTATDGRTDGRTEGVS